MKQYWREFDGVKHSDMINWYNIVGNPEILIYDKVRDYTDTCSANIMDSDGWHRGRKEPFTHYIIIEKP